MGWWTEETGRAGCSVGFFELKPLKLAQNTIRLLIGRVEWDQGRGRRCCWEIARGRGWEMV